MRRDWHSGQWGPPNAEWWAQRRGTEEWQRFGRKMAARFFFGVLFFFGSLMMLGAFIATAIVGTASVSRWVIVGLVPVTVVVVIVLILRSVRRTWLPVRDLIRAAGSLADGDYSARVETGGSAAIRPVARSFNDMARRLERADEERRQLLADLGHELRTPLTVVQGEIEAMLDGVHQPDPDHLELLLEEVAVMERLLEDLRTLSLAEAGALTLHPEPVDVPDLIDDVLEAHRRTATAAAVVMSSDIGPHVGELVLDPVRIREVLTNLVINALRAMPEGGTLTVAAHQDGASLNLAVIDTGVGIAPEDLDQVFDRFRKGSTSKGSGLGLTISRDLVEAHGGTIGIESMAGVGTTVTVTLPLVTAPS
ncbi:MAG: HAMP domain-containing sensor histidine kinase [Acidimicrobiia bacterium]|nr:HAMP domain-containing sensor histidine kinase [Acidimicrobiia bacterium]